MSRHVSYRGVTIDMDSLRRENEKVPAIGNMKVNAKGDQINRGTITKTADQIARENHRVQSAVVNTGLKGRQPETAGISVEPGKPEGKPVTKVKATVEKKVVERELPSGDIIIESEKDES
jgi:hypothetical protein